MMTHLLENTHLLSNTREVNGILHVLGIINFLLSQFDATRLCPRGVKKVNTTILLPSSL